MRKLALSALLATSAALAGCVTVPATPVAAAGNVCGNYGYVDVNNDGFISGSEWNTYRTSTYSNWDTNADGRISQSEFQNCWYGGGFYRDAYYNRDYWNQYWSAFDANRDGYLSNDEYWSAQTWTRIDRNNNGRIDSDEWMWWGS
jgi:hypothetical protein